MEVTEKITQLLIEKFESDEAFADCFPIEVVLKPGNRLEVVFDSDSGVSLQKCQRISRHLEKDLDEQGWLGEKYVIEVSSPGASRPLTFPRQYIRHIGRTLQVSLNDGTELEGEIISADQDQVMITYEQVTKDGKKKIKSMVSPALPYQTIKKGVIKLPF
jgi:ribosome maturation factor RimP